MAAFVLAGTALALVGGVCGYFGTDFGYHLWSAGRCATSSCILDDASWWVRAAGILAGAWLRRTGVPRRAAPSVCGGGASATIYPAGMGRACRRCAGPRRTVAGPAIHGCRSDGPGGFTSHTVLASAWCRRASSPAMAGVAAGSHSVSVLAYPRHVHRRRAGSTIRWIGYAQVLGCFAARRPPRPRQGDLSGATHKPSLADDERAVQFPDGRMEGRPGARCRPVLRLKQEPRMRTRALVSNGSTLPVLSCSSAPSSRRGDR